MRIALPIADRQQAVADLHSEGMSTRAIGSALGLSKDTIARTPVADETPVPVIGTDGKTYAPRQPDAFDQPSGLATQGLARRS